MAPRRRLTCRGAATQIEKMLEQPNHRDKGPDNKVGTPDKDSVEAMEQKLRSELEDAVAKGCPPWQWPLCITDFEESDLFVARKIPDEFMLFEES